MSAARARPLARAFGSARTAFRRGRSGGVRRSLRPRCPPRRLEDHRDCEAGQEYLEHALATDAGARRLGELGIGTNYGIDRPTGTILLDEKMGGTVHLALGRSYPETGGTNESELHWDLICDLRAGGRITVDGEVLQEGGRFTS